MVSRPVRSRFLSVVCLTLVACGPEEPADSFEGDVGAGEIESEIVGGATTTAYPAVVAIAQGGQAFCTGTLIAPRTVLTADHCVTTGSGLEVWFGSTVSAPSKKVAIKSWTGHPSRDLSVIELAQAVTTVTPLQIVQDALTQS